MPSSFTWLDYSEFERRRMLDVIDLFSDRSTVDELGIGTVRDVFADKLFPGTSTIQTRAKYFLFVPWVYLIFEGKRVSSQKFKKRSRKLEIKLILSLLQSEDLRGVIGRQSKEKLQRHASEVYWQGLHQWGIRKFDGSEPEYRRSLDGFYTRCSAYKDSGDEFEGETRSDSMPCNWDTSLPPIPIGFPENQSLELNSEEANYLREQIITNCPDSMLAFLVGRDGPISETDWAWDYKAEVGEQLRTILIDGQNFSEVIHGAQLLYNLMLSEKTGLQDRIDGYREELDDWWDRVSKRKAELAVWNLDEFWRFVRTENRNLNVGAKNFIDQWITLFREADGIGFLDNAKTRSLIERREVRLKRGLARLTNDRALELWQGRAGANQLDLRWRSAQTIISDILNVVREPKVANHA